MNLRALIVFAMVALVCFTGCRKSIQSAGGMAPTIKPGERVTINYAAHTFSRPRRWDVVAFKAPSPFLRTNAMFLKRVIALPLETISLTSSGIVVNGKTLRIPAVLSNIVYYPPEKLPAASSNGLITFPYTVPAQHYFLVGDSWANSMDSRYYGAVPATNILGKVRNK